MTDETRVDERDAFTGRCRVEQLDGLVRIGGGPYVESQRPQIALERRSGYRRTGEDGGRQTNSLLGTGVAGLADVAGMRHSGPVRAGGMSAEAIGCTEARVHGPFTPR
ncbi:hypothetical protein [Streptomyces spiramyceticus]|uniref:hypothetical protein n=1 Tax=Streptomyces spiramyceticus TaxID=299717 RepID=UPI00237ADAED|nr:hypothetical protein [Streptomyces spiramyceticus]